MKIIGLTGSIGMGKSTTAGMFESLGVPVFDADAAVHTLYAPGGQAVPLIRAVFPDAIGIDGGVNRKRLGEHMRADPLNLDVLSSFVHPWVGDMRADFIAQAITEQADAVVFDIPLLFETGGDSKVDVTVVVTAPPDIQRQRVLARPGMTVDLFESLLVRQMPDAEKRKRADFIISTAEGLEATQARVKEVLAEIMAR
ncbi:dephospho-CoA kinase [Algimonas arctica]|uniref:Dephospho-CoA kinase n=1 Tax=Algimonas arctica TaxID=1479486 RepID=A0A8J3G1K4_9PROT|nr:dephospho-CoA kinase [Algimonas arctica]GHA86645.1 dephospho-CoA kinase [Algimonas arctica]